MSYRFMRLLLFFDLPTETSLDRREYRKFHKFLIKQGFFMMQESVYCKMLLNGTAEKSILELINKNKPPKGLVQTLSVTEKQFSRMEIISGDYSTDILNSDERLVIY